MDTIKRQRFKNHLPILIEVGYDPRHSLRRVVAPAGRIAASEHILAQSSPNRPESALEEQEVLGMVAG
jgi:hypothetical protein